MKYKRGNFLQLSRDKIRFLNEQRVSYTVRWLYVHLNELEHKFADKEDGTFFRSVNDLHKDMGMSPTNIVLGIKKLVSLGLIQTCQAHWIDRDTNKKSERHITKFRIL